MINSEDKNTAKENEIERNLENLNYPASEDIYNREDKLDNIDPENISTDKTIIQNSNEWEQNSDKIGNDLDIPGAELDDDQEEIGSEDEENNYYSEGDTE
ncbi:hypothetical protein [Flavobacterium nitrogenifigens]|uniref:Uncharacterized protein n=1 Tax=Flavobacterium nitrogenifigens TaxID=1617283 RepID=A0A521ELS2_9FLAO|nr:hypothetical protein [Flavobacterium nitrogenifigens]KAF2326195.1 hypothetical protein DM397_23410 [Flavobacterium nitrogenifigens]SMO84873.1 hypothetical protein SAMN06265220_104426 [Flavobacterium nitrogenifigens]